MDSGHESFQYLLQEGDTVRCRRPDTGECSTGVVTMASPAGRQQSLVVGLAEPQAVHLPDGGTLIASLLFLTVDYENQTVADIYGTEWELDYADHSATANP